MKPALDQYPYNHDFGFDVPKNFKDDLSTKPEAQRLFLEQAQYFYGKQDFTDKETCRKIINYYAACLLDSDKTIGDMLASLEEFGFLKNTIVILTSDHGEMGGSHGLRHKGPFMYRENINVPLAIRHPDGLSNKITNTLFSSLDIAPTLLGLVGEKYKKLYPDLKGYDHSKVIMGEKSRGKRRAILVNFSNTTQGNPRLDKIRMLAKEAEKKGATPKAFNFPEDFIQFDSRTLGRGIFDGQYKYSRWFCPGDHHDASSWQTLVARNDLELYDVKNDPHELNNLAHHPEKNRELILEINTKLNDLIKREVGEDLGGHMPGDPKIWSSEV
jgi:arylsulfatase